MKHLCRFLVFCGCFVSHVKEKGIAWTCKSHIPIHNTMFKRNCPCMLQGVHIMDNMVKHFWRHYNNKGQVYGLCIRLLFGNCDHFFLLLCMWWWGVHMHTNVNSFSSHPPHQFTIEQESFPSSKMTNGLRTAYLVAIKCQLA